MTDNRDTHSALVAVAGRPNVGKSTLVNALTGEKVSIVTPKPQTTRHRIVGVLTQADMQIGFVDTPGVHDARGHALNRVLNDTASASLLGVDVALLVIEAGQWRNQDSRALDVVTRSGAAIGLVLNKIDRIADRQTLLPFISDCMQRHAFDFVVPVSARRRRNLDGLLAELRQRAPVGPFLFPADSYTDRSVQFLVAETIREKLTLVLGQELPYSIAVGIESFVDTGEQLQIHAVIWIARASHKPIVIGKGGARLKRIGRQARLELNNRLGRRIDLRLWVKLRSGWIDDASMVHELGH